MGDTNIGRGNATYQDQTINRLGETKVSEPKGMGARTVEIGAGQFLLYVPKDTGVRDEAKKKLTGSGTQKASMPPALPRGTAPQTLTGKADVDGKPLAEALASGKGQRTADGAVWVEGVRLDKMACGDVIAEDLYGASTQFPAKSDIAARFDLAPR